jgi:hypothetical protein
MTQTLFVTGMQRSGTTLLEKLLGTQPGVSLMSQPFPLLFSALKAAFLRTIGGGDRYPLGHLFLETRYAPDAFAAFLRRDFSRTGIDLAAVFEEMRSYSGQYTRFEKAQVDHALTSIGTGRDSLAVLEGLYRHLAPTAGAALRGGKETTCEEFLPAMVRAGWRCVLIVRDPRDVVASLNHGAGSDFGGRIKPTLFNVRHWRKSVAFALELEGAPGFAWLRYEDLVRDPLAAMGRIADAVGQAPVDEGALREPFHANGGGGWSGNSSHQSLDGISQAPVGTYRRVLEPAVARFIEASCLPEMRLLEYAVEVDREAAPGVIGSFQEPYATREDMKEDAIGRANIARETRRLAALRNGAETEIQPLFLFARAWRRLREIA